MDDRFFFNPYGFPGPFFGANLPPNITQIPNNIPGNNNMNSDMSPKDFFENQYYYYRYLNEYIDYQNKAREFNEKYNKPNTNNNIPKNV